MRITMGATRTSIFFIVYIFVLLISLAISVACIVLIVLAIKALLKYIRTDRGAKENYEVRRSLGEAIKHYRTQCNMTQEFVAESLGVSRQAVSKWENGTSEPSTSNLLALANLFGISAAELLQGVEVKKGL